MAEGKEKKKLTAKQEQFCQEYLIDLNGAQAATRAGYSKETARSIASELLTKPDIQDYISELKQVRSERCKISQDNVLNELAKIGFVDIRDYYNEGGIMKLPHELSDQAAASLSGIEIDEIWQFNPETEKKELIGQSKKIRMHNKITALEALGKHLGVFEKDNSQKKIEIISPETIAGIIDKINKNAAS